MATIQQEKSLESWLWDAACSIRGAKEAAKYKDYILPLVFTKRLCDVFDDEVNRIAKQVGADETVFIYRSTPYNLAVISRCTESGFGGRQARHQGGPCGGRRRRGAGRDQLRPK